MDQINRIIAQLTASNATLIASHRDPDGDAIGSLLAAGLTMKAMGKQTILYNESPIPAVYRFLPEVGTIVSRLDKDATFDAAVILDCGDLSRIGPKALPVVQKTPTVLNIDHHPTNTGFGDVQLIDPDACATAEIIHRIIARMGTPMDAAIATAIYTGIFTDTGSFRFANTNQAAFSVCNKMVACGADPFQVAKNVYGTYSLGRIKLLNRALDSIEISDNGRLSLMTLTRQMLEETGTQPEDADGLINYARRIRDIQMAVMILESPNSKGENSNGKTRFHVSLRSNGAVDVSRIAALFGGGGHRCAAGFNVHTDIADIKSGMMKLANGL